MSEILSTCPGPGCTPVTGPDVYRAEAHPTTCQWMMRDASRCHTHDELLRPDELGVADPSNPQACPPQFADVPEEWFDPHNRTGGRP